MQSVIRELHAGLVALVVLILAALAAPGDGVFGNTAAAQDAQWIWSPAQEREIAAGACYFRKTIQTDRPEHAEVQITADDAYELFVNGRRAGEGKNWRVMQTHDITKLLVAGRNTIAIKVTNAEPPSAGLAARVLVKASGGTFVAYPTDATWKCSIREPANWTRPTLNDTQWLAARVIGPLGQARPWLDEVLMADGGGASRFKTSREFRVETVVPAEQTGSLLTMAFNEFGEIVASVENGGLVLIRDANGDGVLDKPIEITDKVKNCQGILPLNGQLYVVGNGSGNDEGFGLFRLADTNNDGKPDESKRLIKFSGESHEHGPHAAVLGPDGFIYVVIGNHTKAEAEPAATCSRRATKTRAATPPASRRQAASSSAPTRKARSSKRSRADFATPTTSPSIAAAISSPTTATWSGTRACPGIARRASTCSPPAPSAAGVAAGRSGPNTSSTACPPCSTPAAARRPASPRINT
jgi:hypothetical protein